MDTYKHQQEIEAMFEAGEWPGLRSPPEAA
jgi:hypothetical protein